jgi:four helix bundle protein
MAERRYRQHQHSAHDRFCIAAILSLTTFGSSDTLWIRSRIIRVFGSPAKSTEAKVLGKQLLGSGTSVGANDREAHRGRSKGEFNAKCCDSVRELEESAYCLELLVDGEIVPAAKLQPLHAERHELTAIFVSIIKKGCETV